MKKIVFLISGNIRIYEKNLSFLKDLKEIFKDYQITIASSVWDHQDNIKEFKETYNVQFLDQIKEQNWDEKVSKVKFVTWEENLAFKIPNIFHMWYSVLENIKFLTKISNNQNLNFDYVCISVFTYWSLNIARLLLEYHNSGFSIIYNMS